MATKKQKKVNPKDTVKSTVKKTIIEKLADLGTFSEGTDYGFTKDTVVLHTDVCDIQIKLIAPKTDVTRYEVLEDE